MWMGEGEGLGGGERGGGEEGQSALTDLSLRTAAETCVQELIVQRHTKTRLMERTLMRLSRRRS